MQLSEESGLLPGVLPLAALKDHLRLGSSHALPSEEEEGLLQSHLFAAIAAIEGRIAKALLTRRFWLRMEAWRDADAQALPLAPVTAILEVALTSPSGGRDTLAPSRYRLIRDPHRPRLAGTGAALPSPVQGGGIEILFEAGFGPGWADVPADLQQAVFLLAAEFYEYRHDGGGGGHALPERVLALISGWRQLRILGGGRR